MSQSDDLLTRIRDSMQTLSKSQRAIGRFILEHYDKAAYMTASRLGAYVNVSESTVVRFAIELGYDGYPELQSVLRELIRTRLTAVQRIEITNDRIGDSDVLEKVIGSDIEKLRTTIESIDRDAFQRAVNMIIGARTLYVAGVRTTASLASFLGFNLNMIFEDVRILHTSGGSEMFEQMLHIREDDVLIAISFPRYSRRIIDAVHYARTQGAKIIALTDSVISPIAQYADSLLTAKSDMASFVDSLVAPLSVINALLVALAKQRKPQVEGTFERLEQIWDETGVYSKQE